MSYTLQFGQVLPKLGYLLGGALVSLQLSVLAFACGMAIGLAGAAAITLGPRPVARLVRCYVIFVTNTPQLVQIYLLFFALPDFGILLSPFLAVLIGMTVNAGAYLTEIQRAGFLSVRQTEIDAAETLGMSRWQSIRHVILPHILRVLFPPLSNQFVLMTLGSSMAAVFGVEELTGRALNLNATTFRSIEIFIIVALIYIALSLVATILLATFGRYALRTRMPLI